MYGKEQLAVSNLDSLLGMEMWGIIMALSCWPLESAAIKRLTGTIAVHGPRAIQFLDATRLKRSGDI